MFWGGSQRVRVAQFHLIGVQLGHKFTVTMNWVRDENNSQSRGRIEEANLVGAVYEVGRLGISQMDQKKGGDITHALSYERGVKVGRNHAHLSIEPLAINVRRGIAVW